MNNLNFYITIFSFIIILAIAIAIILAVLFKEGEKPQKVIPRKPAVKAANLKKTNYRDEVKKMAETDPQHVASIIKKWLKEK